MARIGYKSAKYNTIDPSTNKYATLTGSVVRNTTPRSGMRMTHLPNLITALRKAQLHLPSLMTMIKSRRLFSVIPTQRAKSQNQLMIKHRKSVTVTSLRR